MSAHLATDELLAELEPWLLRQRWFAGKARDVESVSLRDVIRLDERVADVFVRVVYADGGAEDYQVPVVQDGAGITDALADATACRRIAQLSVEATRQAAAGGAELIGRPVDGAEVPDGDIRVLGVEQSNSSVVFGDAAILKVFRKLEPGTNPDVELTRALTEAGFPHVPAQRGALDLAMPGEAPTTLAVLADFVAGGVEGWAWALSDPDTLLDHLDELGRAVAGAHAALAERFPTRRAAPSDVEAWSRDMQRQVDAVLATATARDAERTAAVLEQADALRMRLRAGAEAPDPGPVQRIHGDLHLGQVLWDRERGWQLLDFEGEPARPMAERRAPHSPLRDVAGMLRSLEYAAGSGPAAGRWLDRARHRFLTGYREVAAAAGTLPTEPASELALLGAFELDKAVYELGYELANRPDWVGIPVRGILRILNG